METYPLAADTFSDDEIEAVRAVLASRRLTMGERVREFESAFAEWTGATQAVMVQSGSSANLLLVDAMLRRTGVEAPWRPGDEILVPALAWPTTVWPLAQLGLVPVFVDIEPRTLSIAIDSAESALSERTKGMMLIHVLGRAAPIDEAVRFCQRHRLVLLEDVCESLGAHVARRHVGTFGVAGTFSCYFSHHISTVEGGVIVTSDGALADDLRSLRSHGGVRDRSDRAAWAARYPGFDDRFLFALGGYNVRPTEIQAAIGIVQLRKLPTMLERRESLARDVRDWIAGSSPWLELLGTECLPADDRPRDPREREHSWMMLPFRLAPAAPLSRDRLRRHLEDRGVETRPLIAGNLARHPAVRLFQTRSARSLHEADELLARGLMIGCHPVLSSEARDTLARALASLPAA
jgi:CDP-6-deoxy-D-xylo-4-hexulose-3-dehydrase